MYHQRPRKAKLGELMIRSRRRHKLGQVLSRSVIMISASKACQPLVKELSVYEAAAAALTDATKRAGTLDIA
jgi:hypothetical protein